MPKYIFIKLKDPNNVFDIVDVKFRIETEARNDLIEEFECFLMACGFGLKKLEIVEIEKEE